MKMNHKSICVLILILLSVFLQFSCKITILEIEEGSKLLEDGLWRLYIDDIGFGRNVDIYDNTAIVSAKGDSLASVRVFEFDQNNWIYKAFLTEENITQNYGSELVIENDIIAISDYDDNKVYTYLKSDTTWEKLEVLMPTNVNEFTKFGKSLDMFENYLIVGSETGPALLFKYIRNSWLEIASLDVGDEQENEYEIQVRISENFLATCKGRDIYTYNRSGEYLSNKTLVDSIYNTNHNGYYRIDLNDSTLVVGDPFISIDGYCDVMVYNYYNESWINNTKIQQSIERKDFGNKVEICSDHILFSILPMDYFSSNYFVFYELNSTEQWIRKESISRANYRSNCALTYEFAIISGSGYAYIYEYK